MGDSRTRYTKFHRLLSVIKPKVLARLTYPLKYPAPEEALKHLMNMVSYLEKQGNKGLWFLSFQTRGAPFFWLMLSRYVPKDELSKRWFEIVGSNDLAHLRAGVSVNGFKFLRGSEELLRKKILPLSYVPNFKYGTFGSLKAKVLSWF